MIGTKNSYLNIDLDKTGSYLKKMAQNNGYTVKEIQKYLHLSCPQPVYRWFNGQTLPTVDHLYLLSRMFQVHMNDLLKTKAIQQDGIYVTNIKKYLNKYQENIKTN